MLQVNDVVLQYPRPEGGMQMVLDHISLQIEQGERWAVIGPSGCGKSSLLHLLAGLQRPVSGQVLYQGQPMGKPHGEISVILQEYGLFPWKTVQQNVALPLVLQKRPKAEIREQTAQMLEQLQLTEHAREISGANYPGRAAAAYRHCPGSVAKPRVLLMDEPFSALDALTRETMQNIVLELCEQQKLTLVMVTHNIEEAIFLGQKIAVFSDNSGKLAHIAENIHSGQPAYRGTAEFYQHCANCAAGLEELASET